MNALKSNQTVISNTENNPFILPINISQYGHYEADELEVRITNDFIEVSGKQEWRVCSGGANKRSFQQRHIIPKYIDLNAILCRLCDDEKQIQTIFISAPSISLVQKLTNNNQLKKVDYTLGIDNRGIQFLKRYNSANSNLVEKSSNDKLESKSKNQVTNLLFDLVKNPSKTSSNSRLFSTAMGQRNINFVNNLKHNELQANGKIRLNIEQLMKDKKKESKKLKDKNKDESSDQIGKKKSKKRKNKKKGLNRSTESKDVSINEDKKDETLKSENGKEDQEPKQKDQKVKESSSKKRSMSKKKETKNESNLNDQLIKNVESTNEKKTITKSASSDVQQTSSGVKVIDLQIKKPNPEKEIKNETSCNLETKISIENVKLNNGSSN